MPCSAIDARTSPGASRDELIGWARAAEKGCNISAVSSPTNLRVDSKPFAPTSTAGVTTDGDNTHAH
jgi:hypothetical protein